MKRRIYEHDIGHENTSQHVDGDTGQYDIDQPIETLSINMNKFQGPRLSYEQWHSLPNDAKKIWDMLTPEAKSIILRPPPQPDPNENQRLPARPPTQRPPPSPRRTVNEHDVAYIVACLHELHGGDSPLSKPLGVENDQGTSAHEDPPAPAEQPILAHLTKTKPLPPGNIKRLLSQSSNNKDTKPKQSQEITINGTTY